MGKRFPDSALDIMEITCYPVTIADSRFTREYLLQVPPLIAAEAGRLKKITAAFAGLFLYGREFPE